MTLKVNGRLTYILSDQAGSKLPPATYFCEVCAKAAPVDHARAASQLVCRPCALAIPAARSVGGFASIVQALRPPCACRWAGACAGQQGASAARVSTWRRRVAAVRAQGCHVALKGAT